MESGFGTKARFKGAGKWPENALLNNSTNRLPASRSFTMKMAFPQAIGVYDCLYVALAEREACELVTADTRLFNSLQPTYPFIIALASLT